MLRGVDCAPAAAASLLLTSTLLPALAYCILNQPLVPAMQAATTIMYIKLLLHPP
jgi:hypothetical protein